MMTNYLLILLGMVAGGGFVAWRMKGNRSWKEVGKIIIQGGGGPGNE